MLKVLFYKNDCTTPKLYTECAPMNIVVSKKYH